MTRTLAVGATQIPMGLSLYKTSILKEFSAAVAGNCRHSSCASLPLPLPTDHQPFKEQTESLFSTTWIKWRKKKRFLVCQVTRGEYHGACHLFEIHELKIFNVTCMYVVSIYMYILTSINRSTAC